MREPSVGAPYVVIGNDGKEYGVRDTATLAQWYGAGNVQPATKVWERTSRRWTTIQELGVRKQRPIVVTTGDVTARRYQTLDVVFAFVGVDAPAFKNATTGFAPAFEAALDQLVRSAQNLGADGLVWIRHQHEWAGQLGGAGVSMSGTAVKFTE